MKDEEFLKEYLQFVCPDVYKEDKELLGDFIEVIHLSENEQKEEEQKVKKYKEKVEKLLKILEKDEIIRLLKSELEHNKISKKVYQETIKVIGEKEAFRARLSTEVKQQLKNYNPNEPIKKSKGHEQKDR